RKLPGDCVVEPAVDDVYGEAALASLQHLRRQEPATHPPVKPLATAVAHLEAGIKALDVLDDGPVEIRDPHLEAMRHGKLISVHQELVGQRGAHLEELEAAQLVGLGELRQEIGPALQDPIARAWRQEIWLEKPV